MDYITLKPVNYGKCASSKDYTMVDNDGGVMSIKTRTPEAVLDFWLGSLREICDASEENWCERMLLWRVGVFARGGENEAFRQAQQVWCDQLHEEGLETFFSPAELWDTPLGWLAKIIVLDQFGRSVYRGTPVAYANDALTGPMLRHVISENWDTEVYNEVERMWIYVALSHPETDDLQEMSVQKWMQWSTDLVAASSKQNQKVNKHVSWYFIRSIIEHSEAVLIYNRFPHRNPIMNRPHGAGEIHYLTSAMRPLWSYTQPPQPLYYSLHALLHELGTEHDCEDISEASLRALGLALGLDDSGENSFDDVPRNAGVPLTLGTIYRHILLDRKQAMLSRIKGSPALSKITAEIKQAIFKNPNAEWPPRSAKANVPAVIDVTELNRVIDCPHLLGGAVTVAKSEIDSFRSKTGFQPAPIGELYESFMESVKDANAVSFDATPDGFRKSIIVGKRVFKSLVGPMFKNVDERDRTLGLLYELLDMDYSGTIDHRELLVAFVLLCSGEIDEKLGLTFDIFDLNRDGSLDRDELEEMIQTCFLRGFNFAEAIFLSFSEGRSQSDQELITLYELDRFSDIARAGRNALREADTDGDGVVDRGEFVSWARSHSLLEQFFGLHARLFGTA